MKYIGLLSSAASGKLGGVVASHNRGGQYFRQHKIPVQPRTTLQRSVRNQLAAFSSQFKSLTAAQISGWNALGTQVTLKSKIGTSYHPTGQQLFVSCNKNLAKIGTSTTLTTAPTIPSIPAITTFTITQGGTSSSPSTTTAINWSISPSLPSNFGLVLFASKVQTAGRTFIGKSQLRLLAGYAAATSLPSSFFSAYTSYFGPLPQAGKIQFEVRLIDPNSGFEGPPVTANYSFYQPSGTDLFSLAVGSQTGTTTSGSGSVTYTITPTAIGSFAGAINYSVLGLPANCTWAYNHNPYTVASPVTLTITAASATVGSYTFTVQGEYGTFVVQQSAALTIS